MPKEQEPALVSESEYDGMSLGEAISISINDIRAGLLNVEKSLLDLVDMDEITIERYTPCYELSNELIRERIYPAYKFIADINKVGPNVQLPFFHEIHLRRINFDNLCCLGLNSI